MKKVKFCALKVIQVKKLHKSVFYWCIKVNNKIILYLKQVNYDVMSYEVQTNDFAVKYIGQP